MTELCSLWLYTRVEARENEAHVNRRYTQWALLNVLGTVGQYIAVTLLLCGVRREAFPHTHYTVVHVERKSLQSEKPRSKSTQCAPLTLRYMVLGGCSAGTTPRTECH